MKSIVKRLLTISAVCVFSNQVMAQHVYQIRADSVRIYNVCDTAELIIENRTQDTLGFLFNKGKGRTEFRKLQLQMIGGNAIAITGQDTLQLNNIISTAVDTIYQTNGILYYKKTNGQVVSFFNNYVRAGVYETQVDWNTLVSNSYIGSIVAATNAPLSDGGWWNLISSRHRNGSGDGNLWGLQIASGMTVSANQGKIFFRSQGNGSWNAWKEFWHTGNLNFMTKGNNVALKTESDGVLGLESWVRVGNLMGLKTPNNAQFFQGVPSSWALRGATGTTASWLDIQTGDGVSRGRVYAANDNTIGFMSVSGTDWRLKTDASGNAFVTGQITATGFYQSSLRSLKKDIKPFTGDATSILKTAQVRTFIYKADSANVKHIGFIADELPEEMAAPERKGVDEANTVALLVKALQETNAKVDLMEREIQRLQKELTENKKTK